MSTIEKRRSNAWFLLPIFLSVIGGVIAFFILRNSDPQKAKNCLYLGVAILGAEIAMNLVFSTIVPDLAPTFVTDL